eukprot:1149245-Pelagomonas_calceolata.AAC.4
MSGQECPCALAADLKSGCSFWESQGVHSPVVPPESQPIYQRGMQLTRCQVCKEIFSAYGQESQTMYFSHFISLCPPWHKHHQCQHSMCLFHFKRLFTSSNFCASTACAYSNEVSLTSCVYPLQASLKVERNSRTHLMPARADPSAGSQAVHFSDIPGISTIHASTAYFCTSVLRLKA